MLLLDQVNEAPAGTGGDEVEALFAEARRRTRRRWAARLLLAAGAAAIAASIAVVGSGGKPGHAGARASFGDIPAGAVEPLRVAGPLAVAPDGALYVADVASDRVLVRLPDGRFRVVAGTGTKGFSGDGGAALRADLTDVSGLAFSPAGTLYIVDAGRVRNVDREGVISTIAGDGEARQQIARETPATSSGLGTAQALKRSGTPLAIAVGNRGALYISTGSQILRLSATGELVPIRARVLSPSFLRGNLTGFGPIAIDKDGNIDVSGVNGWAVWQVSPNGIAHQIGSQTLAGSEARRSGGDYSLLERGPGGIVFAENGATILRVEGRRLELAVKYGEAVRGEFFWLTYFAFGPHGGVYADELPGGTAFEARQQLLTLA